MPEQEFKYLHDQIRDAISAYKDPGERIAYITGYLRGIDPDEVIAIDQVICILNLRYPEKE